MSIEQEKNQFERETGVAIPDVLIQLYLERGNGGFGPKYGLLGIASGHKTDLNGTMLSLYQSFCSAESDDPNWMWPAVLIPFLHKGCGIHYCIDTSNDANQVIEFDPTDYDPDAGPANHFRTICESFKLWAGENV